MSHFVASIAWSLARREAARRLGGNRRPLRSICAVVLSVGCTAAVAAAGPSAAVEPLGGQPPFGWHANLGPGVVTSLLAIAVIAGTFGLTGCLRALKHGWHFNPRRVWAASTIVVAGLVMFAPVGSADSGSYAAYGRLAASGHNPYAVAPGTLTGSYGAVVEAPWRDTPTIYGPLATGEQWLAAKIAGADSAAHAVFLLDLIGGLAFIVAGLLLLRAAADEAGRRRAVLMFSANPLLLFVGVAGGHLDVLVAPFVVAAVVAARRNRLLASFAAGVLGGAAVAIKASAALVGLALAWTTRTLPTKARPSTPLRYASGNTNPVSALVALALGAAVALVPGYLIVGSHAFDQLGRASGFVSFADPWRIVTRPLQWLLGDGAARTTIRALGWLLGGVLALILTRGMPGRRDPRLAAARLSAVLLLAWLLTAPYVLPWYAVPAWALLALLPTSGYDRILTWWTAVLALAYLPGRQVTLSPWLHNVLTIWKSACSPVLLLALGFCAAMLSLRRRA